jgi:Flp pilus assembly protein TadG
MIKACSDVTSIKSFTNDTRGASLTEFALILPAFLAFIFGCIEFGMIMWGRVSMEYATSQAARYAYVNPSATVGAVNNYAKTMVPANYANNLLFSVNTALVPKTTATITGTFQYQFFFLPLPQLTMTSSVVQPLNPN